MDTLKNLLEPCDIEILLQYLGYISLDKQNKNSLSIAQKTNFWKLTVRLYEIWRYRSTRILSKKSLTFEQECTIMQESIAIQPNDIILDVGTSTGLYARKLQHYAQHKNIPIEIISIDISPYFVRSANQKITQENLPNVRAYVMDTTKLPFKNEVFGKIVIGGSFNEISHYQKAINEWHRVLKQGGLLFSMNLVYTQKKTLLMRFLSLSGIHIHTPEEMKVFFEKSGFRQMQSYVYHNLELALYQKS